MCWLYSADSYQFISTTCHKASCILLPVQKKVTICHVFVTTEVLFSGSKNKSLKITMYSISLRKNNISCKALWHTAIIILWQWLFELRSFNTALKLQKKNRYKGRTILNKFYNFISICPAFCKMKKKSTEISYNNLVTVY